MFRKSLVRRRSFKDGLRSRGRFGLTRALFYTACSFALAVVNRVAGDLAEFAVEAFAELTSSSPQTMARYTFTLTKWRCFSGSSQRLLLLDLRYC